MAKLLNIFTPDQIKYLDSLVEANMDKIFINNDPDRGRDDVYIGPEIDQEIIDIVLSYFPQDYYLYHVTYSDYNNNNINPNLPPHTDPHGTHSLTFDYQLRSNIDWPICIGEDCYSLNDNEAVIFSPQEQKHYRPELEFSAGDSVKIIFFYVRKH